MKTVYRWTIHHPAHGDADVDGADKLAAVIAAAKIWGVRWTLIARECGAERREEVT